MKITTTQRTAITRHLLKSDVLRGLDRTKSKGQAIAIIADALRNTGQFNLGLVTGDTLLGDGGSRFLPIENLNGEQVENACICFCWEKLDKDRMEFLAYVS